MPKRRSLEDAFQKQVTKRFRAALQRTVWFAVPSGGWRAMSTAVLLRQTGGRPGVADFILAAEGRPLALELKVGKNDQSDDQEGFQAAWEANGGVYEIARNMQEVDSFIFRHGLV